MLSRNHFSTIDEYIAGFPLDVQEILQNIRRIVREAAPDATETISYQMPTFKLGGNLVHFAAYQNHIGFYPTPVPIIMFRDDLAQYETSKGAIKFPLNKPIPYDLIKKIVVYRVGMQRH